MIFETERLYVTKWKRDDLQTLHDLYNDTAIKEFILPQLTIEETKAIFEKQLVCYNSHAPFGRYFIVEKSSNKCIGILLFEMDNNKPGVEIGYSLKRNQWKKGYATEVVRESINWIFQSKGFCSMYAITASRNESSKKVLLKCGFRPGKYFTENGEDLNLFSLSYSES